MIASHKESIHVTERLAIQHTGLSFQIDEQPNYLKPESQPHHARFVDRMIFSLILIFWDRIRFY